MRHCQIERIRKAGGVPKYVARAIATTALHELNQALNARGDMTYIFAFTLGIVACRLFQIIRRSDCRHMTSGDIARAIMLLAPGY